MHQNASILKSVMGLLLLLILSTRPGFNKHANPLIQNCGKSNNTCKTSTENVSQIPQRCSQVHCIYYNAALKQKQVIYKKAKLKTLI